MTYWIRPKMVFRRDFFFILGKNINFAVMYCVLLFLCSRLRLNFLHIDYVLTPHRG